MTDVDYIAVQLNIYEMLAQGESFLGIGSGASSVNATQFLTDLLTFSVSSLNQQFEIINALVHSNFSGLTTFQANETAILESRFAGCALGGPNNLTGLPANFSENKTFLLTNLSDHDLINIETYEFDFAMTLNGSYGAIQNGSVGALYFVLEPEISIAIKLHEHLREFSFLRFNASAEASGSGNVSNVLTIALITSSDEEYVEASILQTELSEFYSDVRTEQQFLSVNITQVCDNTTNVCQNMTSYAWDNVIMNEKNLTVPSQEFTTYPVYFALNITELLN